MPWGAQGAASVSDLVQRLQRNDAQLSELHVMRTRRLDDAAYRDLCGALDTNTRCVTLYASGHAMSAAASAGLAATLTANTTLRRLCVGDARFGDAALAALGPGLGAACSLRELDLENKGLSAVGVRQLLDDLQGNTALETLVLSRNDLAYGGFAALASRPLCLQRLVLRSCALCSAELTDQPAALTSVCSLDLSWNDLGIAGGSHLAALLHPSASSLQSLSLSHTAVGDVGAESIGQWLAACDPPQLRALDLSYCGVTAAGVVHLSNSNAQAGLAALTRLVLSGNPLAEEGVRQVAQAFASHSPSTRLAHLELEAAGVTAGSLPDLSAVAGMTNLSILGNDIGDAAMPPLSRLLCGGPAVNGATQGSPDRAASGARPRGEAVPPFAALSALNISGNGFTADSAMHLLRELREGYDVGWVRLEELQIGANPCCDDDAFERAVAEFRDGVHGVDIIWKAADTGATDRTAQQQTLQGVTNGSS